MREKSKWKKLLREDNTWELMVEKYFNSPMPECYQWLLTDREKIVEDALDLLEQYVPGFRNVTPQEDNQIKAQEFVSQCKERVDRWQYGVGGVTLHRGYYCPSPIHDVVVGNCGRGRKQNRITPKTENRITYKYGFSGEQLVYVQKLSGGEERFYEYECILCDGDTQYGYRFDSQMILMGLSKCIYEDGLLADYSNYHLSWRTYTVDFFSKERYEYRDRKLYSATFWDVHRLCSHRKYIFNHDDEGYLSDYQAIQYKDGIEDLEDVMRDRVYKVYERRKA